MEKERECILSTEISLNPKCLCPAPFSIQFNFKVQSIVTIEVTYVISSLLFLQIWGIPLYNSLHVTV